MQPAKDVDGFHPENVGLLQQGRPRFLPCTPAGVMRMLQVTGVETSGKHAVVIGRSDIVGKPMAALLAQKGADATVTLCHSRTRDIGAFCREADILVAALGIPQFVKGDMVKPGAVVIDVGINRVGDRWSATSTTRRPPGRVGDHARARRRGADDDRDAAREHADGGDRVVGVQVEFRGRALRLTRRRAPAHRTAARRRGPQAGAARCRMRDDCARMRGAQNFVMCEAISFGAASAPASEMKKSAIWFAIVTRCSMFTARVSA